MLPSAAHDGAAARTRLPALPSQLSPNWPDLSKVRDFDQNAKRKSEQSYRKRHGARSLPELTEHQQVRARLPGDKHWGPPTAVTGYRGNQSYLIRNKRHLMPIPTSELVTQTSEPISQSSNQTDHAPVASEEPGSSSLIVQPAARVPSTEIIQDQEALSEAGYRTRSGRISKPVSRYGFS